MLQYWRSMYAVGLCAYYTSSVSLNWNEHLCVAALYRTCFPIVTCSNCLCYVSLNCPPSFVRCRASFYIIVVNIHELLDSSFKHWCAAVIDNVWFVYYGSSAGIVFTRVPVWGFAPAHAAPIKVKFGREERTVGPLLPAKFHHDRLRGVGLRPQNFKIWNFINIIAPKGRVPCTILSKFTVFMRVLGLHTTATFGCFSSLNDKIINNLPWWRRFQPNFRWPLAAKLLIGPKNVFDLKWWHGPPLSPCKI